MAIRLVKPLLINVDTVQKEYLQMNKKALRRFLKQNLDVTTINGRIFVNRNHLEDLLRNETDFITDK